MRDRTRDVAHEARIPDYNLELTAGTERNHSCYSAGACVRPTPAINLVCSGGCGISRKIAVTGCKLFLPGPMIDNASAHQKIVLMVVGGIGKSGEVVIELYNSHRKM